MICPCTQGRYTTGINIKTYYWQMLTKLNGQRQSDIAKANDRNGCV